MNPTISAEIERIVKVAQQELADTTARLHEEMRQISTVVENETREQLAKYATESKREAEQITETAEGQQFIRFIIPPLKSKS